MNGSADDARILAEEREAHMAKLRGIPQRRADLAERERAIVHYARLLGITWQQIATALSTTAEKAQAEYGEPGPGAEPF